MECVSQGARGAVAGRDHLAALAQPRIDLYCRQDPHSSVIRCRAWGVPSEGREWEPEYSTIHSKEALIKPTF